MHKQMCKYNIYIYTSNLIMYNTSNVYIKYTDSSTIHWLPRIPTSTLSKRIVQSGLWPQSKAQDVPDNFEEIHCPPPPQEVNK